MAAKKKKSPSELRAKMTEQVVVRMHAELSERLDAYAISARQNRSEAARELMEAERTRRERKAS